MSTEVDCHYENGNVSCAFMPTALDSRSHDKLRFKRSADSQGDSNSRLVSNHPQNSKIRIEGTRFQSLSGKYAIGVMEDGGDQLYLYEATSFSVQALVNEALARTEIASVPIRSSYLEKKKELINTYAPVKKQRQLRAAINSVVSDEKIEGYEGSMESMKQSLKEATELTDSRAGELQETGVLGQMRELLPPFDLTADAACNIYDFSALFPETLLSTLDPNDTQSTCHALLRWIHDDFRPLLSTDTIAEDPFVEVKHLKSVIQLGRLFISAKQEKRKTFAKLLNVFVSMVFLYRLKRRKSWTPFDVYSVESVAHRLGELYSTQKQSGGAIDREGANRLLAHIVLFVLRLTPNWEFDFADLKSDLNLQSTELLSILSFCGITIKGSKTGTVGALKAPLQVHLGAFGNQRKGRGKGKGASRK